MGWEARNVNVGGKRHKDSRGTVEVLKRIVIWSRGGFSSVFSEDLDSFLTPVEIQGTQTEMVRVRNIYLVF